MFRITYSNQFILAFLTGFVIPISVFFTHIFFLIVLIVVIFEGDNKEKLKTITSHPIALAALLLFVIGILGLFYSSASFNEALGELKKYREFLYIPMFLIFFQDPKSRTWGLYGFLAAMGFTLLVSYFTTLSGFDSPLLKLEDGGLFKGYITQNTLMALALYFVIAGYYFTPRWKWLHVFVVLLALHNILFVSLGRTGYIILFCLLFLLSYQLYRYKGLALASITLVLFAAFIYNSSQVFQDRINVITSDLQRYEQGGIDTSNSIGSRLEFYENSLILFKNHPFIGSGTGSFKHEYNILAKSKNIQLAEHPHNEYFMIAIQWGSIGLGLFIGLLILLWKRSKTLEKQQQFFSQGLTITIVIGCLFNSLWLDNAEGHMFAYLIGLLYAES